MYQHKADVVILFKRYIFRIWSRWKKRSLKKTIQTKK